MIENNLIQKYDIPVPRYTSYPPVPFWNGQKDEQVWLDDLRKNYNSQEGLELYIHIPYCKELCFYCGCHRIVSKNVRRGEEYVDTLLMEWNLYLKHFKNLKIKSIHLGGGTPNFLTPFAMKKLFSRLRPFFKEKDFKGSIELDPRTCTVAQLDVLKDFGFQRISMGIQDFDPKVQKAIGRIQSYEQVKKLVDYARKIGIHDINFDLIYGLPYQTLNSIENTIYKVLEFSPSQLAFYSYAHLPEKIPNQRLIRHEALPQGAQKRALYDKGKQLLELNHYHEIGLDHFAKNDSSLYLAKKEGLLRRNFMGHTVKSSPVILGLGASAISSSSISFSQNIKEVKKYREHLEKGELPIAHGHTHSEEEILIENLLQDFFAKEEIDHEKWENLFYRDLISKKLKELSIDGLIDLEDHKFSVTKKGKPFLRVIASVFDLHLVQKQSHSLGSQAL